MCKLKFGKNQKSCFVKFHSEAYIRLIDRQGSTSRLYSIKKGLKNKKGEQTINENKDIESDTDYEHLTDHSSSEGETVAQGERLFAIIKLMKGVLKAERESGSQYLLRNMSVNVDVRLEHR